jgi:hypothetical protein
MMSVDENKPIRPPLHSGCDGASKGAVYRNARMPKYLRLDLPAQLVNARHQSFEMIAIFNTGVFRDLLQTLAFEAD